MADEWNVSKPVDGLLIPDIPLEIRKLRSATKIIISKAHITPGDGNSGGQLRSGATRVYLQSAMPTTAPDGTALSTLYDQPATNFDDGRLWADLANGNCVKVYVGTGAGITAGWQNITAVLIKAGSNIDANNYNVINMKTGTQAGQGIHVGQLDSDHFSGKSTGVLMVRLHSTGYLAKSGSEGLVVNKTRQSRSKNVTGSSDISIDSGTWEDMTNMSLAMTSHGGNVMLAFLATFRSSGGGARAELRFDIDGTPACVQQLDTDSSGDYRLVSMVHLVTSLAATGHTFKVQWKDTLYAMNQDGATYPRELTAVEIPADS